MSANIQNMMEQAKRALRDGNKPEAQQFLVRVTELDQYNEEAWLWLASAVDTEDEKRTCLQNVLVINPDNAEAQRMLTELVRGQASQLGGDLFAGSDRESTANAFDNSGQASTANPFGDADLFNEPPASPPPESEPFVGAFDDEIEPDANGPFSSTSFDSPPASQSPPPAPPPVEQDNFDYGDVEEAQDDDLGYEDSLYSDEIYEEALDLDDEVDYLQMIPDDVPATRVPGTDQPTNQSLMTGVVVLAALNVIALLVLVVQFVL